MSPTRNAAKLAGTMAEHEFTDDEKAECLRLIEEEDRSEEDAIAAVIGAREPEAETSGMTAEEEETGNPGPARIEALETQLLDHQVNVEAIMGPFVEGWAPCSHCDGLGIAPPEPEVQANERFRECPVCNGYAKVKTGSRDPNYALAPCPGCGGRGFQEKTGTPQAPAATLVSPPGVPALSPLSAPDGAVVDVNGANGDDGWGTPAWMGDPNLSSS